MFQGCWVLFLLLRWGKCEEGIQLTPEAFFEEYLLRDQSIFFWDQMDVFLIEILRAGGWLPQLIHIQCRATGGVQPSESWVLILALSFWWRMWSSLRNNWSRQTRAMAENLWQCLKSVLKLGTITCSHQKSSCFFPVQRGWTNIFAKLIPLQYPSSSANKCFVNMSTEILLCLQRTCIAKLLGQHWLSLTACCNSWWYCWCSLCVWEQAKCYRHCTELKGQTLGYGKGWTWHVIKVVLSHQFGHIFESKNVQFTLLPLGGILLSPVWCLPRLQDFTCRNIIVYLFLFFFFWFLEDKSLGKEHTEIFLLCKGSFDTSPKFCLLLVTVLVKRKLFSCQSSSSDSFQ